MHSRFQNYNLIQYNMSHEPPCEWQCLVFKSQFYDDNNVELKNKALNKQSYDDIDPLCMVLPFGSASWLKCQLWILPIINDIHRQHRLQWPHWRFGIPCTTQNCTMYVCLFYLILPEELDKGDCHHHHVKLTIFGQFLFYKWITSIGNMVLLIWTLQ